MRHSLIILIVDLVDRDSRVNAGGRIVYIVYILDRLFGLSGNSLLGR